TTQEASSGVTHLSIIKNPMLLPNGSEAFDKKIRDAFGAICRIVGHPVPLEIERKYLVTAAVNVKDFVPTAEMVVITQFYLPHDGSEHLQRIRKRVHRDHTAYFLTEKIPVKHGVVIEKEKLITEDEYEQFFKKRDQKLFVIEKNRWCFIWQNQYFEYDEFLGDCSGLYELEIELTEEQQEVALPDFFTTAGIQEVTGNERYSNYFLARIPYRGPGAT
ncbi:MAG: CYTH domain-containing protein, partial [Candidatus Pacebacteria bacterium]|nr:CYTH domain-containing protein [Candidatus Paceibacterota bacterium]